MQAKFIYADGKIEQRARLKDISETGAKIFGKNIPSIGDVVLLNINNKHDIFCRVMWVKEYHFGVEFHNEIEIENVTKMDNLQIEVPDYYIRRNPEYDFGDICENNNENRDKFIVRRI
jgi:hypothetical protein